MKIALITLRQESKISGEHRSSLALVEALTDDATSIDYLNDSSTAKLREPDTN